MTSRLFLSALVLIFFAACETSVVDNRLAFTELRCTATRCDARWAGSQAWSRVTAADEIVALTEVDPAGVWECEHDPDVDMCVVVDEHDRVGCFRVEGDFAVAVAPGCAVSGPAWLDVGGGMRAKITR